MAKTKNKLVYRLFAHGADDLVDLKNFAVTKLARRRKMTDAEALKLAHRLDEAYEPWFDHQNKVFAMVGLLKAEYGDEIEFQFFSNRTQKWETTPPTQEEE